MLIMISFIHKMFCQLSNVVQAVEMEIKTLSALKLII